MNDLELPPRRSLPPEVRARIRGVTDSGRAEPPRQESRYRGPLAVAAGVAVLAAGAVVLGQSVNGTPEDFRPGTTPPTTTAVPVQGPELTVTEPDATTTEDLDRCGAAAAASPRADEFAPRAAWEPVFTATDDVVRVVAFREYGGKPGFCEVTETTATVSDPSAETMPLGIDLAQTPTGDLYALYVSPTGMIAGVAQNVDSVEFGVTSPDPARGVTVRMTSPSVLRDELFVVNLGALGPYSRIDVTTNDLDGENSARGEWTYDPDEVRPIGATITDR